jgi:hypothetical protein
MTTRLLVGLLAACLLVAMLPGVTVAKDDGKSDCKKGGWTDWVRQDDSTFADQGDCVAYVAEGGTLMTPPTFQSVCLEYEGQYWASYLDLAPACLWWGIGGDAWLAANLDFLPICPLGPDESNWVGGWRSSYQDPDYLGCMY